MHPREPGARLQLPPTSNMGMGGGAFLAGLALGVTTGAAGVALTEGGAAAETAAMAGMGTATGFCASVAAAELVRVLVSAASLFSFSNSCA